MSFEQFMDTLGEIISEEYYNCTLEDWFENTRKLDTIEDTFYFNLHSSVNIEDLRLYVNCVNLLRPHIKFSDKHYLVLFKECKTLDIDLDTLLGTIHNSLDTILHEYFEYKINTLEDEDNLMYLLTEEMNNV